MITSQLRCRLVISIRVYVTLLWRREWIWSLAMASLVLSIAVGARAQSTPTTVPHRQEIEEALQAALDRVGSRPQVANAMALVSAPRAGVSWCKAVGLANPQTGERMTPEHLFRIASVSKTFTAVVALQLVEEGHFTLDSPLADLLTTQDLPQGHSVDELAVRDGTPCGNKILVRHLLSHRSGLADYWDEKILDGSDVGETYLGLLADSRPDYLQKQWNGHSIIDFYFECGFPKAAKCRAGEAFNYADTNFVLLGLVIEKFTQKPLHVNYRERVYKKLGLADTFLEWYEPIPQSRLAHCIWINPGRQDVDLMESGFNSSADWAGGGLISTAANLDAFLRGIFGRRLFQRPTTLNAMLTVGKAQRPREDYGLGIYRYTTKTGHIGWGHFGASGVVAFHFPDDDVTLILLRGTSPEPTFEQDFDDFLAVLERLGLLKSP